MRKFVKLIKDLSIQRVSVVFVLYAAVSVVSLLLSNIVVVKNFSFFNIDIGGYGITLTGSVVVFPFIYICSDIFSEVYGYIWSRAVSWLAFFMNILMALLFNITIALPGSDEILSNAFATVLGSSFGILAASLIAFMLGDLFNDIVFEQMKKRSRSFTKKGFMARSLISSLCGEIVDTGVFLPVLFLLTGQYGTTIRSAEQLITIVLIQGLLKVVLELLFIPVTISLVHRTRFYENKLRGKSTNENC